MMVRMGTSWGRFLGLAVTLVWGSSVFGQIAVDGQYWSYNGRRVLLLGGWNHGHNPFIDHDTDNDRDSKGVSTEAQIIGEMDELVEAGGNYLRCVLDPGMAAGIQGFDFCAKSGAKYDLNVMAGPFWDRLAMFVTAAERRPRDRPYFRYFRVPSSPAGPFVVVRGIEFDLPGKFEHAPLLAAGHVFPQGALGTDPIFAFPHRFRARL